MPIATSIPAMGRNSTVIGQLGVVLLGLYIDSLLENVDDALHSYHVIGVVFNIVICFAVTLTISRNWKRVSRTTRVLGVVSVVAMLSGSVWILLTEIGPLKVELLLYGIGLVIYDVVVFRDH